jgi:MFS family permease
MGLLTLVEDRPTPKAVYNWRVYAAACVASWAACMIGYDSAFIGTTLALPSFVSEFRLAANQMPPAELALTKANIVSVYQAGAFFGALGAYVSSHYFGRKKSLIIWTSIVCRTQLAPEDEDEDANVWTVHGWRWHDARS